MTLSDILAHGWPDAQWTLDPETYAGLTWHGPGEPPTEAEIEAMRGEVERAELRRYAKQEAARRILARFPDWTQRNMTARGVELIRLRDERSWTAEEQAEADALQADWDWIKGVRARSDEIEADIDAGTITTKAEVDAAFG